MIAPARSKPGQFDPLWDVDLLRPMNVWHPLNKGVVGWWKVLPTLRGERLFDLSPYKNHGTLTNMDVGTDYVVTDRGHALDFDGSDDYVDLGAEITDSTTITVSVWVNLNSGAAASNARVVSKGSDPDQGSFALLRDGFVDSDDSMVWRIDGDTVDDSIAIPNNWTHYVGTVDAAGDARLYRNGNLVAGPKAVTLGTNNLNVYIGVKNNGGSPGVDFWAGQIDDVRIYDRALSGAEVFDLYEITKGGHYDGLLNRISDRFPGAVAQADFPFNYYYGNALV